MTDVRPHAPTMSRPQRRRLERAQEAGDRVTASDALFFRRFPDRRHRVRQASRADLEANAAVTGVEVIPTEPGRRWFVAVKQLAPGIRTRLFVQNDIDADPDMPEADAEVVYTFLSRSGPRFAEIEAKVRAVVAKRGARE